MSQMDESRAIRALQDVIAVEKLAPGLAKVVTWSDTYTVDARGEGCTCPDKEYNLNPGELCKHHIGAVLATTDIPSPYEMVDSLTERPRVATDGGRDENPVEECDHEVTETDYIEREDGQHEVTVCSDCNLIIEDHGTPDPDNVRSDGGTTQRVTPATTRDCHHCQEPMEVPVTFPEEWTVVCQDCYPLDGSEVVS